MHKKVRKAIIPAAGLGTRFLPATKTVPKEMLTIVDRPIILFIVEEAVRAGIEDIVIIQGRHKNAIEDFFDVSYELQDRLEKDGKHEWLELLLKIQSMANIISIRQKQALGLGHAVLCGQPVIGDEAFAVLLGDEIMVADQKTKTVTELLTDAFLVHQKSSVAIMEVPESDVSKYGIVEGQFNSDKSFKINKVTEKPLAHQTQSRWALPGRYVFTSEIFEHLKNTNPGKNGEIQLTDAMSVVAQKSGMFGYQFESKRYDAGDKFGFLQANIELALGHPILGDQLKEYILKLSKSLQK